MIAIPLSKKDSTTISNSYGKAPYFALLDIENGYFSVLANPGCGDAFETATFIKHAGIKCTIFYNMGENIYKELQNHKIKIYSSLKRYLSIDEIYTDFLKNDAQEVRLDNYTSFIDSCSCTCKNK